MKLLVPAVASIGLSVASLSALAWMTDADYYGVAATPEAAERTIVLKPNTRSVAVKKGEIVKFVVNGKEFAWDFDGTAPTVSLARIAPQGAIDQNVTVYIAPSEKERPSGA
jgi:hypothetical protein